MQKTLYQELSSIVLGYTVHFQADLTYHDRKTIEKNPGVPFVYGYRKHGTDLILMPDTLEDYKFKSTDPGDMESELMSIFIYIDYGVKVGDRNTRFLYCDGKQLYSKTCDELRLIYFKWIDKVISNEKDKEERTSHAGG